MKSRSKKLPASWHAACNGKRAVVTAIVVGSSITKTESTMLYYAIVFFVIALIAAVFGFGGIAAGAVGIAKILFFLFLIIAVVTFLMSLARK
jgi:uncharacterized membrane protein YtjA (UPF0391 family)